ncbi:hypothetical protein [Vibrio phage VCPH]|nr:hypothetical protein [Vibrio phage VCPH]
MEKPFGKIRMDAEKKKSKTKAVSRKSYPASRVLPFSIAALGVDGISMLPLITILPQDSKDIEKILKKRRRVIIEILQEIHGFN